MPLDTHQPDDFAAAVAAWRPDRTCVARGDEYVTLAIRCWAAGGLSDQQITDRMLRLIGYVADPPWPEDALLAVGRHAAFAGQSEAEIADLLAMLSIHLPDYTSDASEIAAIARAARREFGMP